MDIIIYNNFMIDKLMLKIDEFRKAHLFLFLAVVCSSVLGILPAGLCFISDELRVAGFIFLIPSLFVILVAFIANKTSRKFKIITNIFTFVLNLFVIIFIQFYVGSGIFIFMNFAGGHYTDIKYYKKALTKISYQERIKHFPLKIPKNAQDVELYEYYGNWHGSEGITLKITIDSEYIENELKKYKYVDIKNYSSYNAEQPFIESDNGRIKIDGCKLYVINDREHEKLEGHHFPYSYGFCIFKDKNQIIYYYTNPDL